MRRRELAALAVMMALLSGCFQEEAPRHVAPAALAANPVDTQAGTQPANETNDEEPASVPMLAAVLNDSADPDTRREAIYAIADAGETDDAAIIGHSLTDPDSGIREAAIEALTGIGGQSSADWLSLGLGDPDPRVRQTAVEALGEVGGDTARFLLQQALTDVDEGVREAAKQMIEEQALARDELRSSFP
ncbi:MAG: HEAT repeat domain-containing protein [Steroidobacteraceae bacterium]